MRIIARLNDSLNFSKTGALCHKVRISAVGRESRDGKFPGIPRFLAFPFPGNSGPGSREKEPHEIGLFQANFEGKGLFNGDIFFVIFPFPIFASFPILPKGIT